MADAAPFPTEARLAEPGRSPRRPARIQLRRDFLKAARAATTATPGFVLQARRRSPEDRHDAPLGLTPRVGFTASKKVGDAVRRNRAKRRLRALADAVLPLAAQPGWDYVMIARRDETARRDFAAMTAELAAALALLHGGGGRRGAKPPRRRR